MKDRIGQQKTGQSCFHYDKVNSNIIASEQLYKA
jgi:uncharacterized protein YegP (UPF0339 family)